MHRRCRTAEARHPRSRRATYGVTDDELIGVLDRTTNALLDTSRTLWLAWIGWAQSLSQNAEPYLHGGDPEASYWDRSQPLSDRAPVLGTRRR